MAPSERFKAAAAPISSVRSCAAAPVAWLEKPKTLGHQTWVLNHFSRHFSADNFYGFDSTMGIHHREKPPFGKYFIIFSNHLEQI